MKRRHASMAASLAVTATLLALAARNVRFGELWLVLKEARWLWLPAMASISLLDLAVRSLRWRLLLGRSGTRPRLAALFRLEAIGLAINNVLFMRLGEVARGLLAARELGMPAATALASVAVERALDVAALLTLFSIAGAFSGGLVPSPVRRAGLLVLAGAVGALVLLVLAEKPLEPGGSWERVLRRWPKAHGFVLQLAAGAAVLRDPRAASACAGLSLVLWAKDALFYWFGARALGLGAVIDYPRSVLVLSWAGAGAALPAAPGAFGAFEAMVKSILVQFGVDAPRALAFAVFTHMVGYLFVTMIGLTFLWRVGLPFLELRAAVEGAKR